MKKLYTLDKNYYKNLVFFVKNILLYIENNINNFHLHYFGIFINNWYTIYNSTRVNNIIKAETCIGGKCINKILNFKNKYIFLLSLFKKKKRNRRLHVCKWTFYRHTFQLTIYKNDRFYFFLYILYKKL